MSFKAKLFIEEEDRNVLNASQMYSRFVDVNGRPTSKPVGGLLEFSIESTSNDSFFYNNMFSQTRQCKGEIIFYKRDGFSTLFKIEFANAQILSLNESFHAIDNQPLHMNISIGWGIMKMRGVIHEKTWNPNNPFEAIAPTVISEEEEKEIVSYHITDTEGNELEEYEAGDKIILNIETKNRVGDKLTIHLEDKTHDFKYNGELLKNDMLKDYVINNDLEEVELEVVNQSQKG